MNPWRLDGTRAVVTGASRGIGAAIVAELLRHGAAVLGVARSVEELRQLRDAHAPAGDRLHTLSADMTDGPARARAIAEAKTKFGGLDLLVNNVGLASRLPAAGADLDEFRRLLELNLLAAFDLSRLAYSTFCKEGGGGIINISSVTGVRVLPLRVLYGTSKAALNHLTEALAAEWGPDNIRVNAVLPWFTRTTMTAGVLDDETWSRRILGATPLGRVAMPEDIAQAVAFLAMPASSYITGQLLTLDGGFSAKGL